MAGVTRTTMRAPALLLLLPGFLFAPVLLVPGPLAAQLPASSGVGVGVGASGSGGAPAVDDFLIDDPNYFFSALGSFTRPITTEVHHAQAYFDQGVQMLFAFTPADAVRSFQEAQRQDPLCAMCFWGEAWARGPYLNGGMSANAAPLAHAAAREALRLSSSPGAATPVERALIEAMATRYEEVHGAQRRAELDRIYAEAMEGVVARFPDDLDAATLYGEALMLLEPRRGVWEIESPSVQRIHQVLGSVLDRDLGHPGACHLMIHATEATTRPDLAEPCADLLGSSIPGASHINHMPSHTYNRVGRWGDAVRSNIEAWHSDQRAEWGEGFAIYPSHNLHMLLFSASYDGQGAIAIQAARDYAKISTGGIFYRGLTLLRFGRFDEILELRDAPPPTNGIYRGLWEFALGYAELRMGNPEGARSYLARVEEGAADLPSTLQFRGHTAAGLLGITGGILRAELLRSEGNLEGAIALLERAVEIEDGLIYDEPEPLPFTARHWLGAVLLEADRPAEAEAVYRTSLEDHPHNGWSLFGLEQALRAQGGGRSVEADEMREAFRRSWERSDTLLRSSRF